MLHICEAHCDTANHQIIIHCDAWPDPVNLTRGTDPVFKRALKQMLTWHLLSTLVKRVQAGDRKDLIGITPNIDRHATFQAMQTRVIKKHVRTSGLSIAPSDGQTYTINDQVNLWKRHITTVISGACRYLDRLHQAKIVDTDICQHPECNGARCDAEHW